MMRPSNDLPEVYLCREPIDFRKGINGLSVWVEDSLSLDPLAATLFVFCNRRRDEVKILYWERSGFCLWQKRLEKARYHGPRKQSGAIVMLTGQQLNWLIDGVDISRLTPHENLCLSSVL
ncbi:IS66 family insertion sequence element accessory protein TnpB [Congregibacter litoralis]|uniref:Transposase n=1 Tax=Congregibacter litoralis KT71 TaxID=314285 RepID=A4AC23_9GAMM|nr:IS66 family insertion sequence element accessory protein TnpB [Congregibacter litoralis]EAQ96473.1 Transposase [Congregibacter litoralis KT71]